MRVECWAGPGRFPGGGIKKKTEKRRGPVAGPRCMGRRGHAGHAHKHGRTSSSFASAQARAADGIEEKGGRPGAHLRGDGGRRRGGGDVAEVRRGRAARPAPPLSPQRFLLEASSLQQLTDEVDGGVLRQSWSEMEERVRSRRAWRTWLKKEREGRGRRRWAPSSTPPDGGHGRW
jgi:hypothetical protein